MGKFKVINTMADGTVIEDLTGYVIPECEATSGYYQILSSIIRSELEKQHTKKQQTTTLASSSVAIQSV